MSEDIPAQGSAAEGMTPLFTQLFLRLTHLKRLEKGGVKLAGASLANWQGIFAQKANLHKMCVAYCQMQKRTHDVRMTPCLDFSYIQMVTVNRHTFASDFTHAPLTRHVNRAQGRTFRLRSGPQRQRGTSSSCDLRSCIIRRD